MFLSRDERTARRLAGRCMGPSCTQPAEPGHTRCRSCQNDNDASIRRWYHERATKGLCVGCGAVAVKGRRRCPSCQEKSNARVAALKSARVNLGLCYRCGAPRGLAGSGTMCETCLQTHNERASRYRSNLRLAGLCRECGEPSGLRSRCERCNVRRNIQERTRRRVARQVR
jgi:hypothetical protein